MYCCSFYIRGKLEYFSVYCKGLWSFFRINESCVVTIRRKNSPPYKIIVRTFELKRIRENYSLASLYRHCFRRTNFKKADKILKRHCYERWKPLREFPGVVRIAGLRIRDVSGIFQQNNDSRWDIWAAVPLYVDISRKKWSGADNEKSTARGDARPLASGIEKNRTPHTEWVFARPRQLLSWARKA